MKTEIERMAKLEEKVDNLEKTVCGIKKDIKEGFSNAENKIDNLVKELDDRYASKIIEKIVYGAVGMILTAVFGSLIYLVVVH